MKRYLRDDTGFKEDCPRNVLKRVVRYIQRYVSATALRATSKKQIPTEQSKGMANTVRMSLAKCIWMSAFACLGLMHWTPVKANTVTYVYTDPQGTPLAEADVNGNITATFDYTPYGGQALGTAPNGPGYTGHVNDPDTGLVYMQARYYDPATGRFLSVDPVAPAGGNAFNFSRYAYASNNPVTHTDPDGRQVFGSAEQAVFDNSEAQANSGILLMCGCDPIYKNLSGTGAVQSISTPIEFGLASGVSDLASGGLSFFTKAAATASADFGSATTLYRAVCPSELQDIQDTGAFRNLGPGSEGKYFTPNAASASSYAKQAVSAFGDAPYTMVSTQVQNSVLQMPGTQATVDRGIQSFTIPNGNLPGLVPTIHNSSPIPPLLNP